MKCFVKTLLVTLTAGLLSQRAWTAEDSVVRPVTSAYMLEVGSSHIADTYLTPLKYTGWHASLGYQRRQMMKFAPDRWVMSLNATGAIDRTLNPARNATMYSLDFEAWWSMERRFMLAPRLAVGIGGATSLTGGVLYVARNSNNPAAAKGAWTVDLTAYASYRVNLGRLPVTFGVSARVPALGVFFSPNYGELYYEIYLGNREGLVQCAWPGNYRRADLRLWADLHFGGTSLRLGYHGDLLSTKAHDIVSRHITHAVTIGIVTEWLSINTRHNNPDYSSALY